MHRRTRSRPRRLRGFTLIEVLLAMVVTIMVLATCGMLYFSIAQAWISHKQGDAELQHNHSILAFLEDQLCVQSVIPSDVPDSIDLSVSWSKLPEASTYDSQYLSWCVEELPAFLMTNQWMDHVAARLYLKYDSQQGLSILWHPEDEKIDRMDFTNYRVEDYSYEFPLSLRVVSLSYGYWDAEDNEWEIEPHTRNYDPDDKGVPDALILEIEEQEIIKKTFYIGKEQNAVASS